MKEMLNLVWGALIGVAISLAFNALNSNELLKADIICFDNAEILYKQRDVLIRYTGEGIEVHNPEGNINISSSTNCFVMRQ